MSEKIKLQQDKIDRSDIKYNQLAEVLSDLEDPVSGFKAIEPKLAAELKVDSIADVRNEMEKII